MLISTSLELGGRKSGVAFRRSRKKSCVRQNRVVLAVVATVKPCGGVSTQPVFDASSIRKATVTKTNSSPRRARHKPSTHCAGKAGCLASPVCRCAASCSATHRTVDRGCQVGTRSSLRPLTRRVTRRSKSSGAISRETAASCLLFKLHANLSKSIVMCGAMTRPKRHHAHASLR